MQIMLHTFLVMYCILLCSAVRNNENLALCMGEFRERRRVNGAALSKAFVGEDDLYLSVQEVVTVSAAFAGDCRIGREHVTGKQFSFVNSRQVTNRQVEIPLVCVWSMQCCRFLGVMCLCWLCKVP